MSRAQVAGPWLVWCGAGLLSIVISVVVFCPAAWMSVLLERQSGGRLVLGDAQGSVWQGSAFIGAAANGKAPISPLVPGRFSWRLSPLVFVGQVDLSVENPTVLQQAVQVSGTWRHWLVSASSIVLPAERLVALGAPLNTIAPTGQMHLSWSGLQIDLANADIALEGDLLLALRDMGSRMSALRPLGAYDVRLNWHGQTAQLDLTSVSGPLLLRGTGSLTRGRLQFSGQAEAQEGHQEQLANLLNLLGRHHTTGNQNIIALEFK